jgi:hypothetical protein
VGKHCVMRFEAARGALKLEVLRGLDRGVMIVASAEPIAVEGAELRFVDGRPRLKPAIGAGAIDLNGVHAGGAVQLCHGDRVELGRDRAIEVV